MSKHAFHRWFHTLVVAGASITGCGDSEEAAIVTPADDAGDATSDAPPATSDAPPVDSPSIIPDVEPADATRDTVNDYRCCIITR
jgi:hypothetical protein